MSRRHLRHDTTCQNCGDTVQKRFCGTCGQENTETRQSFGHLLRHFIEDLTHYDTAFWLTMRYLLFRPAYLTKEYLRGRRNSFVPPVRLYIFISFVTFLLPYVIPDLSEEKEIAGRAKALAYDAAHPQQISSLRMHLDSGIVLVPNTYKSVEQLDSVRACLPPGKEMGAVAYWTYKRYIAMNKYNKFELGDKFFESFGHNLPKALFIYLPLFALVLWLFHGKKRWLYFDHAIFTLHYFSFLLLIFNLLTFTNLLFFGDLVDGIASGILVLFVLLSMFVYFFMAHKKMYEESRLVSFIKATFIYSINLIIFFCILTGLALISLYTIH